MIEIYFDGGCKPNPGKMETCIVVREPGQKAKAHAIYNLGYGTNNDAEWAGLIWAIMFAKAKGFKQCSIKGDSKLVINQALGSWKINKELHIALADMFKEISQGIDFSITHVYRDSNLAGIYLEHGRV